MFIFCNQIDPQPPKCGEAPSIFTSVTGSNSTGRRSRRSASADEVTTSTVVDVLTDQLYVYSLSELGLDENEQLSLADRAYCVTPTLIAALASVAGLSTLMIGATIVTLYVQRMTVHHARKNATVQRRLL